MHHNIDDDPEEVKKLKHQMALLELEQTFLKEMREALTAYEEHATPGNMTRIDEAMQLVAVAENNSNRKFGDPDKWDTFSGLVTAAIGITGFNEAGFPQVDESRILKDTQLRLAGNKVFYELVNEYLQQEFGLTVEFKCYTERFKVAQTFSRN